MKKNLLKKVFFLLFFLSPAGILIAQNVVIDASKLRAGENRTGKTDFSKSFSVEFTNNKVNAAIEIQVTDEDGVPVSVKKEIKQGKKNSFIIDFTFSERKLFVKKTDGKDVGVSSVDFIQILYGIGKSVLISNENQTVKKTDGPTASGDNKNSSLASGIELHDALLAKYYYETGIDSLYILLAELKKTLPAKPNKEDLLKAYSSNNFIVNLLNSYKPNPSKNLTTIQGGGIVKGVSSFISNIGNTDVTTIADGIARFLVKRTKEELNIAFFQHFKDLINDDKYKDGSLLFPKTAITLNAIDQEIYQFENYITTLRESFESDLSTLLDHMPDVINEGRFSMYFNEHHNTKYAALMCLFMAKELLDGAHPGKVLQDIPEEYTDGFIDANVTASIRTIQLLSASIRSRGNERYWTSFDSVKMLIRKEDKELVAANFYIGFLYENAGKIEFKNKHTLQRYLEDIHSKEPEIKNTIDFVSQISQHCNTIEASLQKIRNKKPDEPTIDVFHRLFNSFADLAEQINKIGELSYIKNPIEAKVKKYLTLAREASDFALNTGHKNYGSAVVNAYNFYLAITEVKNGPAASVDKNNPNKDLLSNAAKKAKETGYTVSNENAIATSDFIRKYGNFMANAVKAKNSEEVSAAIESVALPVGSASIKRHSEWNIALNAYVGIYLGGEKIKGVDTGFKANSYGITAPIGISISKGINWQKKGGWSASLFISVIDLGAPVAFRFKDDKTESIPTIQLKDIVSPGIFASIGFPRFPVSCNVGWQAGPVLRKIDAQYADKASSNYSRWSISLAVDIPVLNFYTRRNE